MELRTQNAQLPWNSNDYFQKTTYFTQFWWKSQNMASRRKLQWKWMSRGHLGRKLPWTYRGHLRRKHWKLSSKGTISLELNPWNLIFPGVLDWKHWVGDQKTIFSTPSRNLIKLSLHLYQIRQFWSNRMGESFGPQGLGARPQCAYFREAWHNFA